MAGRPVRRVVDPEMQAKLRASGDRSRAAEAETAAAVQERDSLIQAALERGWPAVQIAEYLAIDASRVQRVAAQLRRGQRRSQQKP